MCTIGLAGLAVAWPSAIWLTVHQSAHLGDGTHAFVGQTNEVVQCQSAQEGAVLAEADTPTKQWGPRVTSVERVTPNRSALNAATSVPQSQRVLHSRRIEYQIEAHACKSAATRVAWAWDGGYEHSATSDSLAQPLSTSASREVHAAATAHTPALPTFQQHSSESCAQHGLETAGRPSHRRLATIPMIGIANDPYRK